MRMQLHIVTTGVDSPGNGTHRLIAKKTRVERLNKKNSFETVSLQRFEDELESGALATDPAFDTLLAHRTPAQWIRKGAADGEFDVNRDGNLNTHNSVLAEVHPCALSHISS